MPSRILLYGGSFNPVHNGQKRIVEYLACLPDARVKVIPCGPRPEKLTTNDTIPLHRAAMADLGFSGIGPNVSVELFDLERPIFTRSHELEARYAQEGEVWHVVGADQVRGGAARTSFIQTLWAHGGEMWQNSRFMVFERSGKPFDRRDLPPHAEYVPLGAMEEISSTIVRNRITAHELYEHLVPAPVASYIERHDVYRGRGIRRGGTAQFPTPRFFLVADERNPAAVAARNFLLPFADYAHPNCIVVLGGDGTMLHAIRDYWRKRLPFFGINFGHRGFLMNDCTASDIVARLVENLEVHLSPLLSVRVTEDDGRERFLVAFNDAWMQVVMGAVGRFTVAVDGEMFIPKLEGDGVLVSTAAGSTAYARALGMTPTPEVSTEIMVLAGISVGEPAFWKGANLPPDAVVDIRLHETNGPRTVYGFADGVTCGPVRAMRIERSLIAGAELLFTPGHNIRRRRLQMQFPPHYGER